MKPEYFVVKKESNPLWKVYIDWINKTYNIHWDGDSSLYYGYDGNNSYNGTIHYDNLSNFKNNPTVLTLDQWHDLFIDVLPEKWYLELNEDTLDIANKWRKSVCSGEYLNSILTIHYTLVSKHAYDNSYFYMSTKTDIKKHYKDYQEITTEQFIKHVYNPKFNIMKEYVIKNLTPEHGAEIVQHFKDAGVETNGLKGAYSEKSRNMFIYYGVIDGKFNNYSLETVQSTNTSIRELPKKELKMYSIKEVETSENLVVYLDSQKEWNKLKTISNKLCFFRGKHCYSLHNKTYSPSSSKINSGSYTTTSTIITINQIKELNMEKEIVGYKLIKPEYHNVVKQLTNFTSYDFINLQNSNGESYKTMVSKNSIGGTDCYNKLKEAGVLDLWFEKVYKTETLFNVEDWVYIEKAENGAGGVNFSVGQITKEKNNAGLLFYEEGINVKINSSIWKIGKLENVKIRLATKEEIAKAQEKVYSLGINEKFEILVRNGKCFYGSEDVTESILALQRYNTGYFKHSKQFDKYTFTFKDIIISKSGCILKDSLLSQWLAIDLS